MKSCVDCTFFLKAKHQVDEKKLKGWCLRFPPTVVGISDFENERIDPETYWPEVDSTDWCGEHVRIDG